MKLLLILLGVLRHARIPLELLDSAAIGTLNVVLPDYGTGLPPDSVTQLSVNVAHLIVSLSTYLLRSNRVFHLHSTC